MEGEGGILAVLTIPFAFIVMLGGFVVAVVLLFVKRPAAYKWWVVLLRFLLFSTVIGIALVLIGGGGLSLIVGDNDILISLLMFPVIGFCLGFSSVLASLLAAGWFIRRKRTSGERRALRERALSESKNTADSSKAPSDSSEGRV